MGSERFSKSVESGYNKGTIKSDIRYLVVSKDVRRHRLISISYISLRRCHGRGREFESRRPRHSFQKSCTKFNETNGGKVTGRRMPQQLLHHFEFCPNAA
jgi:hypothetical protein